MPRGRRGGVISINTVATLFLLVIYSSIVGLSIWLTNKHFDSNTAWTFVAMKLVFFTIWYVLIIMAVTRKVSVTNFVRGSAYMLSTLMVINGIYGLLELDFKVLWGMMVAGFGALIATLAITDVKRL